MTSVRVMTYALDPEMVSAMCETFAAMGRPYSKSAPTGMYEGFQDQYFIMVETPRYEDESLVKGYLDMVGVRYEVITVEGIPATKKGPTEGKYAMITVKHLSKIGAGAVIEQLHDFGLNHRIIEELGGMSQTIDIFCDEREDVVKVGTFCSSIGLEMGISYADKRTEDRVRSVVEHQENGEDMWRPRDSSDDEPKESTWKPRSHFIELNPVHSILLYRAYYAEEARKRHSEEKWFSQTDRDIRNRELWRAKAIEAGVPEAQADRYIYSGEQDFMGAGY